MAAKDTAPKAKPRQKAKKSDQSQAERFKRTARELGIGESDDKFERTVRIILPEKKQKPLR